MLRVRNAKCSIDNRLVLSLILGLSELESLELEQTPFSRSWPLVQRAFDYNELLFPSSAKPGIDVSD